MYNLSIEICIYILLVVYLLIFWTRKKNMELGEDLMRQSSCLGLELGWVL